ncbi:MAG: alcohol dehydrogenase, partial [Chloroflexota bacterium]
MRPAKSGGLTMLAARLERPGAVGTRPLTIERIARPEPGPGELLIRVTACGVCRTDLQLVEGDLPAKRLPIVPGHQAVGVVVALGEGVHGWKPGDRAGVAWLAGACGTCPRCKT